MEIFQQWVKKQTYPFPLCARDQAGLLFYWTVMVQKCEWREVISPKKTCSCKKVMLRKSEYRPKIAPACPFFVLNRRGYVQQGESGSAGWSVNHNKSTLKCVILLMTRAWPVCAHAQEILMNAFHSDFDRTAHMHRQEIYHSFSHSSCETKNNHSVTPAQWNIGVNIQAGYKKDFSRVCCPWICVSVCARWRMPGISHDILFSVL